MGVGGGGIPPGRGGGGGIPPGSGGGAGTGAADDPPDWGVEGTWPGPRENIKWSKMT